MIGESLVFIKDIINDYYIHPNGDDDTLVELANIAKFENGDSSVADQGLVGKVICSLVNIEEEKVLKNGAFHTEVNGALKKHNPIIYLNLYVLFSATNNNYNQALDQLSYIITFFQGKFIFDHQNTTSLPGKVEKLIFDIYTINFESLNHLWGILGGKQFPSILYKVRLIPMKADTEEIASIITGIGNIQESL